MPDSPHLAVASALSSRFRAVLAEAWHFGRHWGGHFSVLHAGPYTPAKEETFRTAFSSLGLPEDTSFHCAEGPAADTLIRLARENRVDMLLAGALERDLEPHFLSGVARELLRRAPCSLVLFTKPQDEPVPPHRVVVMVDYSPAARAALQAAIDFAHRHSIEEFHVLSVFTPFAAARARMGNQDEPAGNTQDEQARLDDFVSQICTTDLPIDTRVIQSTTGMGAADFIKSIGADLLVIPAASNAEGNTLLSTSMDWVAQVIPCTLWVVKPSTA